MFRPIRIKNYVAAMESYGFRSALVLSGSGIELARLSGSAYLIDIDQTNIVIGNINAFNRMFTVRTGKTFRQYRDEINRTN